MLRPKYIIYDFESDTHTDTHKANHVEVDIMQVGNNYVHTLI